MDYGQWKPDAVQEILDSQRAYFDTGVTKSLDFRVNQLKNLKRGIKKYEKDIMLALYKDLGKHKNESYITEIGFIYSSISYMIKNLGKWAKPEKKHTPVYLWPAKSYVMSEPYGTVLILGAYNYPVQLLLEPLIGAIAAGNTALVKTSEMAVHTSSAIRAMLEDTFESRYIKCVEGNEETGNVLIHAKVDYIFFTGSPAVGKLVMEAAAQNLVPVTLELGGKSPAIVDKSANLKEAARRIIWGKTLNAGQTCVAPDYVLVQEEAFEQLTVQMKKAVQKYYGKDIEKSSDYGRIIHEKHFNRIRALIEEDGENILFGGHYNAETRYIEPTVLRADDWEDPAMQEEIFGPILPVIKYKDLDTVIRTLRGRPKPLALYLFTGKRKIEKRVLRELSSGNACINDTIMHIANHWLPFGGVGNSGMGSYHGQQSFITFSHKKGVLKKSARFNNTLIYPPFSKNKLRLIKKFLK
ncbi:aldehyde dehydrogenase [Aminipila luticellarii]|uniref:Aldehyde dehydrogenase n=1 Tax=Aminipila luticellarii TaxID=2507160 RepID=A0A410PVZ8_9FIRM|nr:aldehyde dehydrogenase [Aminipila luticellarii]QAT43098.1 aldehyde dehydrogenase [Aminipila luticellarii]